MTSSTPRSETVLAIDPGTVKCGVAIVAWDGAKATVLAREVVPTERLVARVLALLLVHGAVGTVLIGNATRGPVLLRALREALPSALPVLPVEEAFTSQRARQRFHLENPPRGLLRLLPPGLRQTPRPYDDYVAVLLAEDYFNASDRPR